MKINDLVNILRVTNKTALGDESTDDEDKNDKPVIKAAKKMKVLPRRADKDTGLDDDDNAEFKFSWDEGWDYEHNQDNHQLKGTDEGMSDARKKGGQGDHVILGK